MTKKINVLILIDKFDYHGSYINGPTRYYSWLVKGIDRESFSVHLCALRGKGKSDDIFRQENIDVSYFNAGKYNPFTFISIINYVRRNGIDILHLTGYGSTTFGRLASAICRKPAIIHEHWVDPNLGKLQVMLERSLGFATTKAIAISEYAREFLINKKGIKEDKIAVIPNGVPLDRFRNVDEQAGKRKEQELGIANDVKIIGIIGMLHENKGHKYFIEAASLVSAKKPKTKFLIIGDGEIRERLERQVSQLGLENQVIFMGHQNDIPAILKMLDIFVMASISETAPLSLLEAMAAKKAIITTDCGGPSEMITDGETGFIVPVKDSSALANKIEYLIDNPSKAELLSQNAYLESDNYNLNSTIQKMEQMYEATFAESA
ncbi:MAG: glycosyltransferase family 4 protein [Chloroflexi bacterium]|nr:glycosyltransferase family 4 protein [Chloroflexota bacterium]